MNTTTDQQAVTAHEDMLERAMAVLEDNEPARIAMPGDVDEALKNAPAAWYVVYKTVES
ncbi:MAG TPA: hypothetical protein VGX49_17255 [Jatrophihabitans sp.]|jgi:hypothetical protein|nr:hypothetical protein [Jatrophihabitans sp.]